ncbi:MAG: hypothetical protein M3Q33_03620 [Acidobacteriota bacterium]|nr:hypothetical protein [Acidobacteriota bacterium]
MSEENSCDFESVVVKSLKSGFLSEEISEHTEACVNCRETAKVVRFFQTNLKSELPPKNLPAAGLVWWKSRLREKRRAADLIAQPILIARTVASVLFFGIFVWLFNTEAFELLSLDTALNQIFTSIEPIIAPMFIGIVSFLFICTTLIFALRRFLLEK